MAPLPHNNTDIYYLDYEVGGIQHVLEMRVAEGTLAGAASASFDDFLSAMDAELFSLTVLGMRLGAKGSNITIPATYSGATAFGSDEPDDIQKAQFYSFVGRGADGRRTKVSLYSVKGSHAGNDFRVPVASQTSFTTARSVLQASSALWLTIGETVPIWKTYVNFGWNSYWQRQLRKN